MKHILAFLAAVVLAAGLLAAVPVQASEPIQLAPAHQVVVVSSDSFALEQPFARCPWGCSFHYFAPGDSFTADYVITSPFDGARYYVTTVDGQAGYVLVPPRIGVGH